MGGAFVSAPLYFYNLGPMSKAEQLQSSKELEESCSASMAGLPRVEDIFATLKEYHVFVSMSSFILTL
jgi:hypothetical protein